MQNYKLTTLNSNTNKTKVYSIQAETKYHAKSILLPQLTKDETIKTVKKGI
jgi:hypothetical protein